MTWQTQESAYEKIDGGIDFAGGMEYHKNMANNISKDLLEPETGTQTEPVVEPVTRNGATSDAAPVTPPVPAIPAQEAAARREKRREAFRMLGIRHEPGPNDWQKTVGMFRDNAEAKETAAQGRRIREERKSE